MGRFDETWEYDPEFDAELDAALGAELDPDIGPEELYLSLISDEERYRAWPESAWAFPVEQQIEIGSVLFADHGAEAELLREIRLSELWFRCQEAPLTVEQFHELAVLVTEVEGLPDSLCTDCGMLRRPRLPANWALAATALCRAHLRFRLERAQTDPS